MNTYVATMLANGRHKELREAAARTGLTAGQHSRRRRFEDAVPSFATRARHRRRRSVLSPRTV